MQYARNFFTHRPAPINTTSDKATCVTTSRLRKLSRRAKRPSPGVSFFECHDEIGFGSYGARAPEPKTNPVNERQYRA